MVLLMVVDMSRFGLLERVCAARLRGVMVIRGPSRGAAAPGRRFAAHPPVHKGAPPPAKGLDWQLGPRPEPAPGTVEVGPAAGHPEREAMGRPATETGLPLWIGPTTRG